MSAIPPAGIGSVIQSVGGQHEQARVDAAERNERAAAARRTPGVSTEDVLEIEATDSDTRIHTDSGGQGSQGRHDGGGDEKEAEEPGSKGTDRSNAARPRLDITA